jgi:hypothetical protein
LNIIHLKKVGEHVGDNAVHVKDRYRTVSIYKHGAAGSEKEEAKTFLSMRNNLSRITAILFIFVSASAILPHTPAVGALIRTRNRNRHEGSDGDTIHVTTPENFL